MPQQKAYLDEQGNIIPEDEAELDEQGNIVRASTMDQGPPEPSVMDERGVIDKSVDWLPSIGGAIGGFASRAKGTPIGAVAAGIGGATGELGRQGIRLAQGRGEEVPDTFTDAMRRAAQVGLTNAAQETVGRGAIGTLKAVAPKIMDAALGAQKVVRRQFPKQRDILPDIALRERAVMGNTNSLRRIEGVREAANAAINPAAQRAETQGYEVVSGDVLDDLNKLRDRFVKAKKPELVQAMDEYIADAQQAYPLKMTEAIPRKQVLQAQAKGTLQGSADPRVASVAKQAAGKEQAGITRTLHDEQRAPGVGPTLQRAQEMLALQRTMENVPKARLTGSLPLTTYALRRTAMSPQVLSRTANAADMTANLMKNGPTARIPDALVRQMFLQLLEEQGDQQMQQQQ